jgi:hypothetical protein
MSEVLSSQHIDALQAVDLRVGWIRHGRPANSYVFGFPGENGPAIYGVADTDYAVPAALLSDMGPGDISARERIFNQGWWGEAPRDADILSDVNALLFQSPYVDRSPLRDLHDYDDLFRDIQNNDNPTTIHSSRALKESLIASLHILRTLRIGDPFLYVDGLAAAKGIRRVIADTPNEEYRKGKISMEQRNSDMARGLGEAAVALASIRDNGNIPRPKVAFTVGMGHKEVEEILDSYGIPYSSMVAKRPLADKLFDLGELFKKEDEASIRFAKHWARMWFRNLRQQGHTPLSETLGKIHFRL